MSASSSRIATLLKRPSKNAPRVCSSRLASRASGSFRHFMNQLRLCNRSRAVATPLESLRCDFTQPSETGVGWRYLSRGGERRGRRSRPEGDKRIERSKLWGRQASAVEWLAVEAKPPGVKWLRLILRFGGLFQ